MKKNFLMQAAKSLIQSEGLINQTAKGESEKTANLAIEKDKTVCCNWWTLPAVSVPA